MLKPFTPFCASCSWCNQKELFPAQQTPKDTSTKEHAAVCSRTSGGLTVCGIYGAKKAVAMGFYRAAREGVA